MGAQNINLRPGLPCQLTRVRLGLQAGVTSIEYALIASLIAMAIVVSVGAVGEANLANWTSVVTKVLAAVNLVL